MKTYSLKEFIPSWHFDPATVRQVKVLKFFGLPVEPPPTKGEASRLIGRIFSDTANQHLWAAYVYITGDEDASAPELRPHDRTELAGTVIPDDWRPKRGPVVERAERKALEELVGSLLREGSPFDDPLPVISIKGTSFCFTGSFNYGSRKQCRQAVVSSGGSFTEDVTSSTDALVIGSGGSAVWSHGNYGNKIQAAMVCRMRYGKPLIIPEAYWRQLLSQGAEARGEGH